MTQQDYIDAIQRKVKDDESRLTTDDWTDVLSDALTEYNTRRPDKALAEQTGDGTAFLDVPDDWDEDFSDLLRLDELDSTGVPTEIRKNRVRLELRPSLTPRLMRMYGYFSSGTTYRITYTVTHTITAVSSSVPSGESSAVVALAASLACTRLAAAYAQSVDPQIGTITMDYKSKTSEYRSLAKDYRAEFDRAVSAEKSVSGRGKLKTWRRDSPLLLHP